MKLKQAIEEIRNRADITDIVSSYLQLKKRGRSHLGLCPFHSEKTPSFNVSQEKGLYHCFGCGEGGNLFDFIMKIEKVDFVEAVKIIGEKIGIEINLSPADITTKNQRQKLLEIVAEAHKYFYENNNPSTLTYLEDRGVTKETIINFQLGHAKEGWDNLFKYLIRRGFSDSQIAATGLIIKREGSKDYYDRFRARIIFPVFDLRRRVIGFSGRSINNIEPKYLNSPDSLVFHKGETLFGLNLAQDEIKKKKYAILVEGNFDLLLCHQHGFKNTVAPLGTAFTINQAKLLKRFTDAVLITYDSDQAGESASIRTENILREAGIKVRIACLPAKKDPADFLKESGSGEFFKLLKESKPALEFRIVQAVKKFNRATIESRAAAIEKVAEILSREQNQIIRDEYINFSIKLLNCDQQTLQSEIKRKSFYSGKTNIKRHKITLQKPPSKLCEAEKCLIRIGLEDREKLKAILEKIGGEEFATPVNAEILRQLKLNPDRRIDDFEKDEEKKQVCSIIFEPSRIDNPEQTITDCINTIKNSKLLLEQDKIRAEIKKQEEAGNLTELKRLQEEFKKLHEISKAF